MDHNYLAQLLFPHITASPADIEAKFPKRNLPEGAKVTRIAPSPTGFVHFGSLFPALVSERLAHQSGGIFYLRIEDTDAKREVEGADAGIIEAFSHYQVFFDEGALLDGDNGNYGPYRQSLRAEIYQTFAKQLVLEGKAYPCFCTAEELNDIRQKQEADKLITGYYGEWAVWRDAPIEKIEAALNEGKPFVLRLRSPGNHENKLKFTDLIKGVVDITENDIDEVLLKSDGIPTYHFAHAVDDHLMGTTHVVRGEEWLSSLPKHIQIFSALGFKLPKYLHISQLMKLSEDGSKKKLSKRDNGAALADYKKMGYAPECVIEYVMTLLNSNFEEWRMQNPDTPYTEFQFSIKKMSPSGCLFDFVKLNDVSKNVISRMSAQKVYDYVSEWAQEYDKEFYSVFSADPDYSLAILSIGRGGAKPRKDFAVWSDVKDNVDFFYDELFRPAYPYPEKLSKEDIKLILTKYADIYDPADDQTVWFDKIRTLAADIGFAADMKEYKKNPDAFRGNVGDVSSVIRVAVTGRVNSPDMYAVLSVLGQKRVSDRISSAISALN